MWSVGCGSSSHGGVGDLQQSREKSRVSSTQGVIAAGKDSISAEFDGPLRVARLPAGTADE
jgi:hypothetical protein